MDAISEKSCFINIDFDRPVMLLRRETDVRFDKEPPGEPDLDLDSLLTIHRYPDGYIGFGRKTPAGYENLFSIKAEDLQAMLPGIAHWLLKDSYSTVNAYYRPARRTNRKTNLPDVARKEKHLARLMACYVDVDAGRLDSEDQDERMDTLSALYRVLYAQEYSIIPPASILARSGRGIYAFWLLHNPRDKTGFQSAWPEKVQLYKSINKALGQRLREKASLPADLRAFDAARVLRVPGSLHSGAHRRVTYWPQLDRRGRPFVYTMRELADFVQLDTPDLSLPDSTHLLTNRLYTPPHYRKTKHPGTVPNRIAGRLKLYALRTQDLFLVLQHRRGILKRGMRWPDAQVSPGRRFTISLLADWLHWCDTPTGETLDTLNGIAETASPAYPSDPDDIPVGELVEDAYAIEKKRRWTNGKLCRLYGITPDMARELDLKTILPHEVREERRQNMPTRDESRQAATEYLRRHIITNHYWPSTRTAADVLTDAGYPVSHETARKLLKRLVSKGRHFGDFDIRHRTA